MVACVGGAGVGLCVVLCGGVVRCDAVCVACVWCGVGVCGVQFDLVDAKELEPLREVIQNLIKKDPAMSRHSGTAHAPHAPPSTTAATPMSSKEEDQEVLQR